MQKSSKVVELDGVGEVLLKKFKSSKKISLKIKRTGEVLVTMPLSVSYQQGIDFVFQQKQWIVEMLKKVEGAKQEIIINNDINNNFKLFTVNFVPHPRKSVNAKYVSHQLTILYPDLLPISNAEIQGFVRNTIRNVLRFEAKKALPIRIDELAKSFGFTYNGVSIRSSVTRWGSCNAQKHINLSFYLMLLPKELIDYVILHELCHTVEMNHGDKFYKLMDKVTAGNTKKYRSLLKVEGAHWTFLKE